MLKTIQSVMKERLAQKWLTWASLGAIAIEAAKKFAIQPNLIQGYIRGQKLFLTWGAKEDPTARFLKKKEILHAINERYKAHGYEFSLSDVRLKK